MENNEDNKNNKKMPEQTSELIKIISIVAIVLSVLLIYHTFSEVKRDNEEFTRRTKTWLEEARQVKHSFNCPYCRAYVTLRER